jgi:hypothetical protein
MNYLLAFRFFSILAALTLAVHAAPTVEFPNAAQPQLATTADGRVWLVYGRGQEVFVARSDDGGSTFAAPVLVANVPKLMLGMRRGPRIAAHGNRVTVTIVAHELLAFHSADGGRSWSAPVTINEIPRSAREGLHDLAVGPAGQAFVTWLDLRNGKTELWGADSADAGKTWGPNRQVRRSPDKSICECCHPTALFDAQGNLAVMWRDSIEGSRDLWIAMRTKGTREFSAATKQGAGTWKLNACPMDGGRIVALGHGRFASVWQRAGEVFFAPGDGTEINLGPGKQPVALVRNGETLVFWQQGTDLVFTQTPAGTNPAKYAAAARFPVLVPTVAGHSLLAYEQGPAKGATTVIVERL